MSLPDRPLVLVGGKGGVGKTTTATALASGFARDGEPTLLVSTDPAHSTADLLGRRLGDEPVEVAPLLDAVEVDPERHADAYVERVRRDAHRTVSPEVRATVDRHLDPARRGPGTLESATLDRRGDLVAWCPGRYRRVVVDTAPTGHTLRLLAMPELLTAWVQGLVRQRERVRGMDRMLRNMAGREERDPDPVVDRLRAQADRLAALRRRLLDDAVVHLVLMPERLPIEETDRALATLTGAGMSVGALVVNRVLPADADGSYVAARRTQQQEYLAEVDRRFARLRRVRVPQLERDVTDADALARVAGHLDVLRGAATRDGGDGP